MLFDERTVNRDQGDVASAPAKGLASLCLWGTAVVRFAPEGKETCSPFKRHRTQQAKNVGRRVVRCKVFGRDTRRIELHGGRNESGRNSAGRDCRVFASAVFLRVHLLAEKQPGEACPAPYVNAWPFREKNMLSQM